MFVCGFFVGVRVSGKSFSPDKAIDPEPALCRSKFFFLNQFQGSPLCLCNSGWHWDAIRDLSGQWFYGQEFTVRLLALILHYQQQLVKSYARHKTIRPLLAQVVIVVSWIAHYWHSLPQLLCYQIIYLSAMPPKKEFRLLHQKQKTPVCSSR